MCGHFEYVFTSKNIIQQSNLFFFHSFGAVAVIAVDVIGSFCSRSQITYERNEWRLKTKSWLTLVIIILGRKHWASECLHSQNYANITRRTTRWLNEQASERVSNGTSGRCWEKKTPQSPYETDRFMFWLCVIHSNSVNSLAKQKNKIESSLLFFVWFCIDLLDSQLSYN